MGSIKPTAYNFKLHAKFNETRKDFEVKKACKIIVDKTIIQNNNKNNQTYSGFCNTAEAATEQCSHNGAYEQLALVAKRRKLSV